jgi:protein phosphatase 2C family protein 2/3
MTNQQVVNYVRQKLSERTRLEDICEQMMEDCLAPDSDGGGVGCDNMSVMIIAILNGKTEEEWYEWMVERTSTKTDALGNVIEPSTMEDSITATVEVIAKP